MPMKRIFVAAVMALAASTTIVATRQSVHATDQPTHVTAPTQYVEVGGTRFAYRRLSVRVLGEHMRRMTCVPAPVLWAYVCDNCFWAL
jgi:hypothetical protein